MKFDTALLEAETTYHVYNRGVPRALLFYEDRNYEYFLRKLFHHLRPVADMLGYCLLRNHFHLLLRTHSTRDIALSLEKYDTSAGRLIGQQFSHFFNGYAQAVNKATGRKGSLFKTPFRRKVVRDTQQLITSLCYIPTNPDNHGLAATYASYPHSSFHAYHPDATDDRIAKAGMIELFGGYDSFLIRHARMAERKRERLRGNG